MSESDLVIHPLGVKEESCQETGCLLIISPTGLTGFPVSFHTFERKNDKQFEYK